MKNAVIISIVIAILGGGAFALTKYKKEVPMKWVVMEQTIKADEPSSMLYRGDWEPFQLVKGVDKDKNETTTIYFKRRIPRNARIVKAK